ncbi:MAG TPA: hypothetical protein VNH18_34505 [Bryobacteraceae bacterium]|nr:hypothetical protein [Bryobacteraceae bacterium]
MDTKEILRTEYRKTWEMFSRHMKTVHELADSGETEALKAAVREADLALAAHKEARDRLAVLLTPPAPLNPLWQMPSTVAQHRVKEIVAA